MGRTLQPAPVLIGGDWTLAAASGTFTAVNPASGNELGEYPISTWPVVDQALEEGMAAFDRLQQLGFDACSAFLQALAELIDTNAEELASLANEETALDFRSRLLEVEIPRTAGQLRQAASAATSRSWRRPVISPRVRIASYFAPLLGPVVVMGPNNFPFAFNSVTGGDAAAALATGHPVIAKASPGHPGTTRRLAELAVAAARQTGVPTTTIQLIYRLGHADGQRLVGDQRAAATAYTGSRQAGMALKEHADRAGKPIYLEMSSVNPVVILPDAVASPAELAETLATSMLSGTGQFCTSPGLIFVLDDQDSTVFVERLAETVANRPGATLLAQGVAAGLQKILAAWTDAGAEVLASGNIGRGVSFPNTLLRVGSDRFEQDPAVFQREAFGNLAIVVSCDEAQTLLTCLSRLEGNLTGTIFGRGGPTWGLTYSDVATVLRPKVGRLLFEKPPTGVAVVDGMNHGGPYPSTGHPGFTAVGVPPSLDRFCMLQSFDNVPDDLLPPELQAANPLGLDRRVDGKWTVEPFEWG